VKIMAWMQAAVLALLCNAVAQAQPPIPREIEGWQIGCRTVRSFDAAHSSPIPMAAARAIEFVLGRGG